MSIKLLKFLIFVVVIWLTIITVCICHSEEISIAVIMYHHVLSNPPKGDLYLDYEIFRKHLDFLKHNNCETITFLDVFYGKIPKKPVILTFDDGTWGHWRVFQELNKNEMKGVFFIVTNFVDYKNYLKSWQIERIALSGMEIGSHTVSHPYLTKLSNKQLVFELTESKSKLERLTGKPVITFAYPFGDYNKKVVEAVGKADYQYSRTTDEGVTIFGKEKNFLIKIIYVHSNTKDLGKYLKEGK